MLIFTENPNKEYDYWSNTLKLGAYAYRWQVYERTLGEWVAAYGREFNPLDGVWYSNDIGVFDRQFRAVYAAQEHAETVCDDYAAGGDKHLTNHPGKVAPDTHIDLENFDEPAPEDKVWDVMIDLETMGTRPNAAIVSIGAIKFDRDGTHGGFYRTVDLQSSIDAGLSVDGATIMWWLQQSEKARRDLYETDVGAVDLFNALTDLIEWIGDFDLIGGIWGNGAAFDNAILKSAWHACGQGELWPHWLDRCYRTEKARHPHMNVERIGVHHNAFSDAATQANHLIKLWRRERDDGTAVVFRANGKEVARV